MGISEIDLRAWRSPRLLWCRRIVRVDRKSTTAGYHPGVFPVGCPSRSAVGPVALFGAEGRLWLDISVAPCQKSRAFGSARRFGMARLSVPAAWNLKTVLGRSLFSCKIGATSRAATRRSRMMRSFNK
jgi:hypothetical protein